MKKYIDADLLREKITEQMESLPREVGKGAGTITSKGYGMMQAFQIMRSIIDSLQHEQPEVDLEKFISDFIDKKDSENQGKWCEEDIIEAMKSSFALGLNARKV